MLSLPSKPWKRIKVEPQGGANYLIVFRSKIETEYEFLRTIHDDLELCLGHDDKLIDARWENKSVTLVTDDFETFKRRLIYVCIMIEERG
jgi:hypothetical protein